MRNRKPTLGPRDVRVAHEPFPRITSVKVGGFKAIAHVQDIRIGSLTVLAGANSSGKSSAIQPLLLLKQTAEDPRGGSDLQLAGSHVLFTDKQQLLAKSSAAGEKPCLLTIGLTIDGRDSVHQVYDAPNGKPLAVVKAHYSVPRYLPGEFDLEPGMGMEAIKGALGALFAQLEQSFKPEAVKVRIERGLLSIILEMNRNDGVMKLSDGSTQPSLFFVEMPFRTGFSKALSGIIHVPGVRSNPLRQYDLIPRRGQVFRGTMDVFVPALLMEWQEEDESKIDLLNEYMVRLGLTSQIKATQDDDSTVEVRVARSLSAKSDMVSIADVGFGVSQVLPVLLALLAAEKNQLVYIEQPEVHLHPNAQVALANVICEAVERGAQVVMETHSELMLLSIQTAVARRRLDPDSVVLHWFTRDVETEESEVCSKSLAPDGSFGPWPEDFSKVTMDAQLEYIRSIQ